MHHKPVRAASIRIQSVTRRVDLVRRRPRREAAHQVAQPVAVDTILRRGDFLSQYLTLHLTHRGALWASGAAQAAQFVRIILVWRGACKFLRGGGCFFGLASVLPLAVPLRRRGQNETNKGPQSQRERPPGAPGWPIAAPTADAPRPRVAADPTSSRASSNKMADWRATSDWTARMRETPNLARNTVFVEEAAPKPQTQPPYRGGRPGAPPSGIRDGDWQCPECPNVNFARRMECHRCGAPRPYEPRKPRARQLRDDEEPRYRRPRPRDRSEERDRHRRRSRSRSRDGGRKFERGRHKGEPPKEDNWRCGHCQNDNWGWRKVRVVVSVLRDRLP